MTKVQTTIQVVLWLVSASYLSAFLSLFFQVPGLYGPRGVTPVHADLPVNSEPFLSNLKSRPTLLWLVYTAGLDPSSGMLLLALLGTVLSFLTLILPRVRSPLSYLSLYLLYQSLHQVGGVFLWFQWDALLLETGLLAVFLAPLEPLLFLFPSPRPWDNLKLWLIRWLAFRLVFSSGVVKLSAKCPTWWGLTTLQVHFESQCIPTQLGWIMHQLPEWMLRLSVVMTFFSEIAAPLLFLFPSRLLRFVAFLFQLQLVIGINLSGNYNFFGMLTLAVCFALLDDGLLSPFSQNKKKTGVGRWLSLLDYMLLSPLVLSIWAYYLISLFKLQISTDPLQVNSSVNFTHAEWDQWVSWVVPLTVSAGQLWLLYEILAALLRSLLEPRGLFSKLLSLSLTCLYSVLALLFFLHSLPSYSQIDPSFRASLPSTLLRWESNLSPFGVASAYGPFRRITGVGGRPEVVIEWSNQLEGDWQELEFLYKPGNISRPPSFLAPHQPRLDWQMWFAALSTYQRAPWLIQFINRLLQNESTVRALIQNPPLRSEYVRASRYLYHFQSEGQDWWRREHQEEYVPPLSRDHKTVLEFLKGARIWSEAASGDSPADRLIYKLYWSVHNAVSPHVAIWIALWLALSVVTADTATTGCGWYVGSLVSLGILVGGAAACYILALYAS